MLYYKLPCFDGLIQYYCTTSKSFVPLMYCQIYCKVFQSISLEISYEKSPRRSNTLLPGGPPLTPLSQVAF